MKTDVENTDGYPDENITYIGFYMMDLEHQGKRIGTEIISEATDYLKPIEKTEIWVLWLQCSPTISKAI